jgi:hypothetical protein
MFLGVNRRNYPEWLAALAAGVYAGCLATGLAVMMFWMYVKHMCAT